MTPDDAAQREKDTSSVGGCAHLVLSRARVRPLGWVR